MDEWKGILRDEEENALAKEHSRNLLRGYENAVGKKSWNTCHMARRTLGGGEMHACVTFFIFADEET